MITVYRPPNYTTLENESLFSALTWLAGCARICIMGDLNLPGFNWDIFVYPQQHLYCLAADFICTHGLFQLVNEPTRSDNILDLVLCTDVLCCDSVSLHPPLASSDHHMVNLSISISIPNEKYSGNCNNIPDLARADWASICALMKSTNCHYATQYWEVFTNYQYYYCKLCSYVQEYWHYKSQTTSYSYKETCDKKLSYWKLYSRFRTNPHRIKYTTAAKKYSKAVMGYTSNKELRLIESNNNGKFYKYVHC